MMIHLLQAVQFFNNNLIQIAALQQDQAPTKVLPKYTNYAEKFLFDLAIKLPENSSINEYSIKLIKDKQPPYWPI